MANTSTEESEPMEAKVEGKSPNGGLKRICDLFKHITVEPTGSIYLAGCLYVVACSQTLQLEKTCRVNLNLGDEICTSLRNQNSGNYSEYEEQIQKYVANRLAWKSILQTVLPCIILIFVGAWSDKTGKRIIVIAVPMIGEMLLCISNILNVFFFYQFPVEVLMFLEVTLVGMVGGWATLFMGIFSYIGDITTKENRTYRLGFVQFFTTIGIPLGMGLSGVVLKKFGYYAVYVSALIMHILNMLYVTCRLKDPERTMEQKKTGTSA